nr:hypothetical protein [Tanacetum cinerariifolium]GEZ44993.1 hypothetical protein [Tanacetum cinerariifolium]
MPPSFSRWTKQYGVVYIVSQELVAFFHLVLKNQSINVAMSSVYARSESIGGGHSSYRGFHQPCLKFTLGIWALPMSSSFDNYACSSGPISSSISRSTGVDDIDGLSLMSVVVQAWYSAEAVDFEGLGAAEPLDGLSGLVDEGGGGGGGGA